MAPVLNVEDLSKGKGRRFWIPTERRAIRFAEQWDVAADVFVLDSELGSLGLIQIVPTQPSTEAWVRDRVSEAVHLRHLLLEQVRPGASQDGMLAYAVEVVFVVPPSPSTGTKASGLPARIGEVLKEIVREGRYLHLIGINLWRSPSKGNLSDEAAFRRAFSWLLKDTEAWYKQPAADRNPKTPFGSLAHIELENFRVAGRREWSLKPGHSLYLLHGHNGSGKSSFSEALELAVTGKLERLGAANHAQVLTNRAAQEAGMTASVTLEPAGTNRKQWTITEQGIDDPLDKDTPGASFRMDQGLADRLSQLDASARARLFLEAFFPDQRTSLKERDDADAGLKRSFKNLPERLQIAFRSTSNEPDLKKIADALSWISKSPFPSDKLQILLPVPAEILAPVIFLLPACRQICQPSGEVHSKDVESLTKTLQQELERFQSQIKKNLWVMEQASVVLQQYGDEALIAPTTETEDLGSLMNQWLEMVALTDILEREDHLLATLDEARKHGHDFIGETAPILARQAQLPSSDERQGVLSGLQRKRKDLRERIGLYGTKGTADATRGGPSIPLAELNPESLDLAAELGVFGDSYRTVSPRLGQAVRRAFTGTERTPVEVRSGETLILTVGSPGWGKELLTGAQRARDAFQAAADEERHFVDANGSPDKLWPVLKEMNESARVLLEKDFTLLDQFVKLVENDGPLSRAINEVMALLTPARWAYDDIVSRADFAAGESSLELETPDRVPVRFRLNTAELNTFSLTLFLLCARQVQNVIRLIVLDDPLQNMDELTVTTVARGLRRLLRLWKLSDSGKTGPEWRLLVMLHSEEDVESIRAEVPCSTCLLPWLSAQDVNDSKGQDTRILPSAFSQDLQPLSSVLREAPLSNHAVGEST
jgi:hypothetical protein